MVDWINMDEAQEEINNWCDRKGWNDKLVERSFGDWMALLHSEISEAYEDHRDHRKAHEVYFEDSAGNKYDSDEIIEGKGLSSEFINSLRPCGIPIEMADLVIRVLHFAAHAGFSLAEMIEMKMAYNEKRPWRHGGKAT